MSKIELPYDDLKQEIISELLKHDRMVMATTKGTNVTARTIICIYDDLTIYCGTKKNSRKYKQIMINPKVAFASGTIQYEGAASIMGHPLNGKNTTYINKFQEQQPSTYENQSKRHFDNKNMSIIKIEPSRIALYKPGPKAADTYIAILEPLKLKAYKLTRDDDQF
jgi:general stress protein 26